MGSMSGLNRKNSGAQLPSRGERLLLLMPLNAHVGPSMEDWTGLLISLLLRGPSCLQRYCCEFKRSLTSISIFSMQNIAVLDLALLGKCGYGNAALPVSIECKTADGGHWHLHHSLLRDAN